MPALLERERVYTAFGAAETLVFDCRADEVVLSGPAGTGKSRGCLEYLHKCLLQYPMAKALVLRKTLTSLVATGLVTYREKVLDSGDRVTFFGGSKQEPASFRYPNGSRLVVGGMDKPSKVMSSEYDLIYVQEATELTENEWESLTTRLRNGIMPYQQLLADVNPDAPSHWLKKRADARKTVMLESRHEDNPTLWDRMQCGWTVGGASYISKLDALTGVRYLRLRKGVWAAAEGMVYADVWDAQRHIVSTVPGVVAGAQVDHHGIPMAWPRYWAVDFGYTNPFCWQAWAQDPDGRLIRYREIYRTHRLVEDHAKAIQQATAGEPRPSAIICDHDAEDRATLERHIGMATIPAQKAVSPGIQAVASRLKAAGDGLPRLLFLRDGLDERDQALVDAKKPTCTEEEIESYVWNLAGGRNKGEEPVKEHDHGCLIAGTMVETDNGLVPIEHVHRGMRVQTRKGFRTVLAAGLTKTQASVITLSLSNGKSITGTPNHPVWINGSGWTPMDAIRYNDSVCLSSMVIAERSQQQPTIVGAQCENVVTTPRVRVIQSTAHGGSLFASGGVLASGHSWRTWESAQPDQPSTALMERRVTSRITVVGQRRKSNSIIALMPTFRLTSERFRRKLQLGTGVRPGISGTRSTPRQRDSGRIRNAPLCVSNAELTSAREKSEWSGSAQTLARRAGAISMVWTTNSVNARLAGCRIRLTAIRRHGPVRVSVLGLSGAGRADVYNLTVEGEPEYFANGVLVHNCDATRYLVMHFDGATRRWTAL